MMNRHTLYIDFGGVYEHGIDEYGIIKEHLLFPVHAENEKMILAWIAKMNKVVYENQIGNYSLSHFDEEFAVFWIQTPINIPITAIARIGTGCYSMAEDMRRAGTTTWQFPYFSRETDTTNEIPQPPQNLYESFITVTFQFWEEYDDLQIFLNKLEIRFSNYDADGQWLSFGACELEKKESIYWGEYFHVHTRLLAPYTLGMLVEIGVHLCHAFTTNLWNHPPNTLTAGNISLVYEVSIKGVTKNLAEWKALPDTYYRKQENIAEQEKLLAQLLVTAPIENKIAALTALTQSRPLLAREQLQLKILQSILDAKDEATINAILAEIAQTPTDAELRKILITQAQSKRNLILDNNF